MLGHVAKKSVQKVKGPLHRYSNGSVFYAAVTRSTLHHSGDDCKMMLNPLVSLHKTYTLTHVA